MGGLLRMLLPLTNHWYDFSSIDHSSHSTHLVCWLVERQRRRRRRHIVVNWSGYIRLQWDEVQQNCIALLVAAQIIKTPLSTFNMDEADCPSWWTGGRHTVLLCVPVVEKRSVVSTHAIESVLMQIRPECKGKKTEEKKNPFYLFCMSVPFSTIVHYITSTLLMVKHHLYPLP